MDSVCVFCLGVFAPDTVVCPTCYDYKGMMPIDNAKEYLGDSWIEVED